MGQRFFTILIITLMVCSVGGFYQQAHASCPPPACATETIQKVTDYISEDHEKYTEDIIEHADEQFEEHKTWLVDDFYKQTVLPSLMKFSEQMSLTAMQQLLAIGGFFDAKEQLETQRDLEVLQARAHKDYHPSDDFCWIGTNVRSLSDSQNIADQSAYFLNQNALARHLRREDTVAARARAPFEAEILFNNYLQNYCDPMDYAQSDEGNTFFGDKCSAPAERRNLDIDYMRLIEENRTLDVDFSDNQISDDDEKDVLALTRNIFGAIQPVPIPQSREQFMDIRAAIAKRSVAEHSFHSIIGLKAAGSESNTAEFMGAVMKELGVGLDDEAEIYEMIGEQPSLFAQWEILFKRIMQNPDFYANLYDKPANVARKSVALKALETMLDRAIYESQTRQEMMMSVMLSTELDEQIERSR